LCLAQLTGSAGRLNHALILCFDLSFILTNVVWIRQTSIYCLVYPQKTKKGVGCDMNLHLLPNVFQNHGKPFMDRSKTNFGIKLNMQFVKFYK